MTIEEICNFLKVFDTGSATQAAEEMYITRQGLRNSIDRLEKELGAKLLERNPRGLTPTDFGRFFAEEARPLEGWLDDLRGAYKRYHIKTDRTITVLTTASSLPWTNLVARLCTEFREHSPESNVNIINTEDSPPLSEELFEKCDVALAHSGASQIFCESIPLVPTEYVICIGKNHPLAGKARIAEEDLKGQRFVTKSRDMYIYEWLRSINIPDGDIMFDSNNKDVKKVMLESGLVIGFSSINYLEIAPNNYSSKVRITSMYPPHVVQNSLYIHKKKLERDIVREFCEFCRDFLKLELEKDVGNAQKANKQK